MSKNKEEFDEDYKGGGAAGKKDGEKKLPSTVDPKRKMTAEGVLPSNIKVKKEGGAGTELIVNKRTFVRQEGPFAVDDDTFTESHKRGTAMVIRRPTVADEFMRDFGHQDLKLDNYLSTYFQAMLGKSKDISGIQIQLLNGWNGSRLSFYNYVQQRLLAGSAGAKISSTLSNTVKGDYSIADRTLFNTYTDAAFSGSKSFGNLYLSQIWNIGHLMKMLRFLETTAAAAKFTELKKEIKIFQSAGMASLQ